MNSSTKAPTLKDRTAENTRDLLHVTEYYDGKLADITSEYLQNTPQIIHSMMRTLKLLNRDSADPRVRKLMQLTETFRTAMKDYADSYHNTLTRKRTAQAAVQEEQKLD